MPPDHELTERLRGVAGLRALVGPRIRWVLLDSDDALPAVTLQWVGGGFRERAMGRDTGDVRARLQVSCWAQRHDEAAKIAEPVRRALQRWPVRDTSYHGVLQDIYLDTELDLYEPDVKVHHRVLDFEVVYTETPT